MPIRREKTTAAICLAMLLSLGGAGGDPALAQDGASFQIVWVVIGEVATASGRPRAGRQLFKGPDIVSFSLQDVDVEQVRVQPEITNLAAGQRVCMTDLRVTAFAPDRSGIEAAPLSISIRQDHRQRLSVQRKSDDICFAPEEPGEYPVRVTSLVPAADGTMRGAQFFLRVMQAPE